MRSASDSAQDVLENLTLTLNKARQEAITNEICDICGGAEALK
jgi:F-type H+-transporting ATPase subunit gamma